jgi:hypothetical protein
MLSFHRNPRVSLFSWVLTFVYLFGVTTNTKHGSNSFLVASYDLTPRTTHALARSSLPSSVGTNVASAERDNNNVFKFVDDLFSSFVGGQTQFQEQRRTITLGRLTKEPSLEYIENGSMNQENYVSDVYNTLSSAKVLDPKSGRRCRIFDDPAVVGETDFLASLRDFFPFAQNQDKRVLLVVMPQLGDFDSAEYAELLKHVLPDLRKANIELKIVGIGNARSAMLFSLHTGVPLENIRVDPTASLHQKLKLHRGPDWDIPDWIPKGFLDWFARDLCGNRNPKVASKDVARAWMNYMAMCAGISAPGTLQEILRGYIGDKSAPERLRPEEKVVAGPIAIKGVSDVKLGPIKYKSLWKDQRGFLRPAELATVRLRSMVEVLSKFDHYVPDQRFLDFRGATFLFDCSSDQDVKLLYEYRDRGVLTYSETPDRPLSFLSEFIGFKRARNPTGLGDPEWEFEV